MSYPLQMLFILALALLACCKVTLQGRASKRYIKNAADSVLFNGIFFAVIALCVLLFFPKASPNVGIALFGALCGAITVAFQTLYAVALSKGPVSLSVLIVNFNVLIATFGSVLFFDEKLYLTQLGGVALLVASMILSVDRKGDHKDITLGWLLLVICSAFLTGIGNILLKTLHTLPFGSMENADMTFLCFMYGFAALFAFATAFMRGRVGKKGKSTVSFSLPFVGLAAGVGAVMALFQKTYMYSLARIDGTFLFPTFTGLQSLGMTVIGVVLFKDKLNKKQLAGVACGIACLVMMNVRLGWSI